MLLFSATPSYQMLDPDLEGKRFVYLNIESIAAGTVSLLVLFLFLALPESADLSRRNIGLHSALGQANIRYG